MRELWFAACGRLDQEVRQRAFWKQAFGQQVTPDELEQMHPLRRQERPPPSEAEEMAAAGFGFAVLERGLAELNKRKRGG